MFLTWRMPLIKKKKKKKKQKKSRTFDYKLVGQWSRFVATLYFPLNAVIHESILTTDFVIGLQAQERSATLKSLCVLTTFAHPSLAFDLVTGRDLAH